jgi:hypothetical protein
MNIYKAIVCLSLIFFLLVGAIHELPLRLNPLNVMV